MVPRPRRPPSQNWKAFLRNHLGSMVSVDFLTVPTLTFHVLYVFIVRSHPRRRVLHFNVVESPSAAWTAQQLREAFPFTSPPKYLLRDRDGIYGLEFQRRAEALGLEELRIAPRSPWQSPYVERLIGSVRRECLDHVIVINQAHLRCLLNASLTYYHRSRTHLALDKDAPEPRPVQGPEDHAETNPAGPERSAISKWAPRHQRADARRTIRNSRSRMPVTINAVSPARAPGSRPETRSPTDGHHTDPFTAEIIVLRRKGTTN